MEMVEVTWARVIRVWWSFIWRCTLFGALGGAALGLIGGIVVAMIGKPELGAVVGAVLGYIVTIPVSIYVFRKILTKKYESFSVSLTYESNT